jgi:hypothetical protein
MTFYQIILLFVVSFSAIVATAKSFGAPAAIVLQVPNLIMSGSSVIAFFRWMIT